ncbi:TIGR03089 family protein [Granulicoccus sp. GXG6511]|uniref:TIGR03089 family protein n=1 Tax=Granulicoccus sp. GXG6511 TaxID=3381351 RepID=UPI003D7D7140
MLLHDLLARRASSDGSGPFLTCYVGGSSGGLPARTELSARSFANWVAKTSNLLVDEAGLVPGDRVELRLAADHPGHWMTLIWTMAAWQAGLTVTDDAGDVIVAGPSPTGTPGVPAYACSLHPLGLGLKDLPDGWTDFSGTALAQPDDWFGEGPDSPAATAWEVGDDARTFAELTAVEPSPARVLVVDPQDAWTAVRACLAAPLLGGGSSVVAAAVDETALAAIAADEKVDA